MILFRLVKIHKNNLMRCIDMINLDITEYVRNLTVKQINTELWSFRDATSLSLFSPPPPQSFSSPLFNIYSYSYPSAASCGWHSSWPDFRGYFTSSPTSCCSTSPGQSGSRFPSSRMRPWLCPRSRFVSGGKPRRDWGVSVLLWGLRFGF